MKTLEAKKRDTEMSLENLRKEGRVPAIVYGKGMDNVMVSVFENDVRSIWHHVSDTATFNLDVEGTVYSVIMKDMQTHPVSGQVLHIDFLVQSA